MTGATIQGNRIGTDVNGTGNLGNTQSGIEAWNGSQNNLIGGATTSLGNIVAFNGGDGVFIRNNSTGNAILSNSIFGNVESGIDLGTTGVTNNDPGDGDIGANNQMNFPVIYSVVITGTGVTITGEARPGAAVQFFEAVGTDSNGEGQTFIGSGTVTSSTPGTIDNTARQFSFTFAIGSLVSGDHVTATATDGSNNTSEFAANVVAIAPGITITPTSGLTTTEAGSTATFTVVLDSAPTANVSVQLGSTDTTEGTISGATLVGNTLTFTTANWSTPQTITVTGVNDSLSDGDITYTISTLSATSSDSNYNGINPSDVSVTNVDNDLYSISGTIYEDVDGDGQVADDGVGLANAIVSLYRDDGDGVLDAGDLIVNAIVANGSGQYSFTGLSNDTYWVVADSRSFSGSGGLNGGYTIHDQWAEQTYGSAGSVGWNGSSYMFTGTVGAFFGGMRADRGDNGASLLTAEHVTRVAVASGNVADVDYGFSYNVITNTRDGDEVGANNRTIQGSLRQFIQNSNALVTTQSSNFQIGTGAQTISLTSILDNLSDTVILDATTQEGFSGTPLIVLDGNNAAGDGFHLTATADFSTIRGFVIRDFAGDAIEILDGSDNNTIAGNYLGALTTAGGSAGVLEQNGESGLAISGANNTIGGTNAADRNLISANTLEGIAISGTGATGNIILGNLIGTDLTGMLVLGNGQAGVLIYGGASSNTIGGTTAEGRNIISGNAGDGVNIQGTGTTSNVVLGNYIGTTIDGESDLGNSANGVNITSTGNTIGGSGFGTGNVVSGNDLRGIYVTGAGVSATIRGNYVGLDDDGQQAIGNSFDGIEVAFGAGGVTIQDNVVAANGQWGITLQGTGSGSTLIGNTIGLNRTQTIALDGGIYISTDGNTLTGNTIAGSSSYGIYLTGSANNTIQGNYIGTTSTGATGLGNALQGIGIDGANSDFNLIGGTDSGEGNVIAHNTQDGIAIASGAGTGISILGNTFRSNGGLAIDLHDNGVTGNDTDDSDPGSNGLQNYPVITSAAVSGSDLIVAGGLDTDGVNAQYRIEFFGNPAGTADSTNGEGRIYLGTTTVTTNGSGDASFSNVTLFGASLAVGDTVTATATRIDDPAQVAVSDFLAYGSTSEMAVNFTVTGGANTAPVFSGLNGTPTYIENGTTVVLDPDVTVFDSELSLAGNYAGATLTLARFGGANPDDALAFDGLTVTTSGANVLVSGVQVGTYTFSGGQMIIAFDTGATQARVNTLMQKIVYWNSSDAPPASVQINWSFSDGNAGVQGSGGALQAMGSTTVNITWVNDSPTVTTSGSALGYTENQSATAVDNALTVIDVDNTNLTGATITISGNYTNGQDVLAFTNQLGITGSWNAATGVLTLTGTATVANYQTALQSVAYTNTSDHPSTLVRTVSFVVNDGIASSTAAIRNITISSINDQPVFSSLNGALTFIENGAAVVLDSSVSVSDAELDALSSGLGNYNGATLSIARNGGANSEDVLWVNAGSGLTLNGSEIRKNGETIAWLNRTSTPGRLFVDFTDNNNEIPTTADVNNVLRQISYSNSSDAPPTSVQLDWTFDDGGLSGSGGVQSVTGSVAVSITPTNDAPRLDLDGNDSSLAIQGGYHAQFNVGSAPVTVADADTTIVDLDSPSIISGEIVSFTGFVDAGQEILTVGGEQFTIGTAKSASVVVGGSTFSLVSDGTDLQFTLTSGTGTAADWQALLSGMTYEHTGTPTFGVRSFIVLVRDSSNARSNVAEVTISVSNNDVPTFSGTLGGAINITEGDAPTVLDGNVTVTDAELSLAETFAGATLTLQRSIGASWTDQFGATGTLSFSGGNVILGGTTIGTYVNSSGTLAITFGANATNGLVNQTLQQITYSNTSNTPPATLDVEWTFFDGVDARVVGITTVNITPVNDAPSLDLDSNNSSGATGSDYRGQYNFGGGAVRVADTDSYLSDSDSSTFTSGTLSGFTGFLNAGQEVLTIGGQQFTIGVTNSASIVVGSDTFGIVYNGTDFQITVTAGSGSSSNWNSLISGMTYRHTSTPTDGDRSFSIVVRDSSGAVSNAAISKITVSSNEAPTFSGTLAGAVTFSENGSPVVLDSDVAITDPELTSLNSFNGAKLTITRSGGSNASDVFSATGSLSLTGGNVVVDGTTIGTYTNGSGTLTMTFNGSASNALVNSTMRQIAYSNTSVYPPTSVVLSWTFNDGNTGSQGAGGSLSVTDTKTVIITATTNDPPVSTNSSITITENAARILWTYNFGSYQDETSLQGVRITTPPLAGALEWYNGSAWTAVALNQTVTRSDIDAGHLRFVPSAGQAGSPYTTIGFEVFDGVSYSLASNTVTVNVTPNADHFLTGNYLQIGLNGRGTLVTDNNAPTGYVTAGSPLGAVSDPDRDGWAAYSGDFIYPGSPVEYWGLSIGGSSYTNDSHGSGNVSGSYSSFQSGAAGQSIEWLGSQSGLDVRQVYSVGVNDLFLDFQVELTNHSGAALNDVYYFRDTDPDNNVDQGSPDGYYTTNTIVSQGHQSGLSMVTATQGDGSYFAILAYGDNSRVTYGGFGNTSACDIYNGQNGLSQTGSTYDDISVSVAYYFASIADGDTVTMHVRYYFGRSDGDRPVVDLDADNSSGALGSNFSTTFIERGGPVQVADTDATILNPEGPALDEVTVTITNLLDGAAEQLLADTTGTKINASYNSSTGVLTLFGLDSVVNYNTVLRSLQYDNSSSTPNTTPRQITVTASFDGLTSAAATTSVSIIATNNAPSVTTSGTALVYTENQAATAVDSVLTVSDGDNTNLTGAMVAISGNYSNGQDVLAFTNQLGITGSWNAATGVLTLSGTTTVANYQTALRSITYVNTSDNPSTLTRTVSFVVNDGATNSTAATRNISVTAVNDTPVVTTTGTALAYTENLAATAVDIAMTVNDVDNASLTGATVSISGNYANGQDVLAFTNQLGITGSWNAATGVLTLTGTTTVANYQTALRSITYVNSSENPSTLVRTVSFLVNDGSASSAAATRSVTVTAVNDAPVINASSPLGAINEDEINNTGTLVSQMVDTEVSDADGGTALKGIAVIGAETSNGSWEYSLDGTNWLTMGTPTLSSARLLAADATTRVRFIPSANFNGASGLLTYKAWDQTQGAVGSAFNIVSTGGSTAFITGTNGTSVSVSAVNDAPVISTNSLTISEGAIVVLGAGDISASDVDHSSAQLTYTVSGVSGGQFEYVAAPGSAITSFTQDDISTGKVQFVHSGGESAPAYNLTVSDGSLADGPSTVSVNFTSINDIPVVTTSGSALAYTENQAAVAVDSALTVSDVDSANLTGATVAISGNYANGQDLLAFTNQLGITGSWNVSTGVLTLTGTATVANYQTALRSVTYVNTSDLPSTLTRTVSFAVNDGTANSPASTSNITVTAVNDDPQISLASVGGPFVEGGPAVLFDTAPFVSDPDSANFDTGTLTASIASAGTIDDRVSIRNQGTAAGQIGVSGSDVTYGGIVIGTWTGGTDGFTPLVVTFNSQATVAAVQALSGNIQFSNVSENPSTTSRLVRIVLTDGDGGTSNNGQNLLAVTAVNDAPVVTTTGTSLTYTENQSATAVDSALTINDVDNTNLTGATVSISGNYANGQDVLAFANQLGITGSWNAAAGVLTLTGTTTVTNYQTALRSITYVNTSDAPSTLARTVSFVVNDGATNSTAATRGISITSVNDAPTIGSGSLAVVLEDTLNPAGATISSLVGSSFADPDTGASLSGIVVTSNNAPLSEGVWQYSTDSGTSWFDVGTAGVSGLALNVSTRVRFVPAADFSGSPTIISFRCLDNTYADGFTSGATRVTVDTSSPGGTSAISSSLVSINTTVTAVNDVPVRTAGSVNNLTVLEDSGLTSLGLSGVTYSPGGGIDENGQTLTYTVTAIPGVSVGRVYLADGTTPVTLSSYTLAEIRGMQFRPTDNASGVSAFQFNVTDSGDISNGGQNSFSEFILLTVSAVNDAPMLATSTGTLAYSENDPPTPVDPSLTVSDVDNVNLTGATITISSNFVFGEDVLAFTNQFGITGSWNAATGVLTLTGTTSVVNYQAALRTVTYANTSGTPSTSLRTIQFQVSDGATSSSPAFREVSVAAVNDAPTISSISTQTIDEDTVLGPLAFTVNDIDSSNLVVTAATSDGSLIPLGNIILGGTGTNRTVTVTPASNLYGGPVTITLTVSDGSLIAQTSFDVIVQPINDPPATSNSTFSVSEIATNGTLVGTVVAGDVDLGDTRSFSVLSGDPLGAFMIDASGQIMVADASQLDFETRPTWTLAVQVRDGAGATATSTVTVNLIDANDNNPVIVSNGGGNTALISLAENTTSVTTVMATDADAGTTLQYSLSGADAGRFQIDINTGAMSFLAAPDFESPADANGDNAYEVTVIANDGVRTDSQALTVSVGDVNEFAATAVVDNDAAANSVAENAIVGTAVGITAFADDLDGTDTVSYSLLTDAGGRFSIDALTGIVRVASTLDYETSTSHTIRVQALSTDGSTSYRDFTITVADVNEFGTSPISDTNPATETLPENLAVGSPVGVTAFADDLDGTDTVSYSLLNSAGGRFSIDTNTGVVTLASSLDYETNTAHTIRVQALSTDGSSTFRDFAITVTDVNEFGTTPISDTNPANETVPENLTVGSPVGVTAFADDLDGTDTVSYSLLNDAGGLFAIDSVTGAVTLASSLDYETRTSHTIRVQALSTDGSSTFRDFTITVTDVNEYATTSISDTDAASEILVEDLAVGSPVGVTAFADDLDGTDTVSYSLLSSAGGRFAINASTGVVTLNSALDYETSTSHTIRVQALSTDGSLTFRDFTFVITDVNEFATTAVVDNDPVANTVAENATIGIAVGIMAFADDLDGTDAISYSLLNDAGGLFVIDASTGIVTVASGLDYETSTSHTIRVQALSTDGSATFRDFTISVTEINEFDTTPITDVNGAVNAVAENSAIGTAVGVTAFADDLDRSDTVTYSLDSNAGGLVAIDSLTGVVTVNSAIDFETTSQLSFIVRATSTDSSSSTQSFTVDVLDRNDTAPIVSVGQTFTVVENTLNGTSLGTVLASDVDTVGGLQNWQIVGGTGAGAFSINAVNGEINVADSSRLNFEATPALTLQVTVSDGIRNSAVQTVTILISDVNERPTLVGGSFTLAENAAPGTVIGSLSASDVDAGDSLSYSIVAGNAGGAFSIDATTGEITVVDSTALDFETTSSFTLTTQVTDQGGLTHQQAVTISLLDLNERPILIDGTYRVPEWSALGTSVGIVSASDVDMGDSLTFRILSGNTGGRFLIDSSTGEIRVANPFGFTHESRSSFTLTVEGEDRGGLTHSALMTVVVDNVNVPPTALDDFYSLVQFEPLVTTSLNGVLLNDSDSDSPSLTFTLISGPANGVLTLNPDGSFTYTSNDLFAGVDTFTYQLSDGFETSRVATVSLTVGLVGPGGSGNTNGNSGNSSGGDNNSDGSTDETDTDNETVDVSGGGSSTATTTAPPLKVVTPPRVSFDTGAQTHMETPTNEFIASPLDPTLGMTTSSTIRSIVRAIERPIASAIIPDLTVVRELLHEPMQDLTLSILENHAMWNHLNSFRDDVNSRRESTTMMENIVVGTTTAVSGGLTVGYVIWLIRGGSLLATMMSVMPTWISFDPLPVMDQFEEDDLIEDEESLASIVTGGR